MSSDPLRSLRLDHERRELQEALFAAEYGRNFRVSTIDACRIRDITRELRDRKPRILHFCGHGNSLTLMFEGDDERPVSIDKDAFAALLGLFEHLDLVVLNACFSEGQAQAIANAVGNVIGWNSVMDDNDARNLSRELYRALGSGESISQAFRMAEAVLNLPAQLPPRPNGQPQRARPELRHLTAQIPMPTAESSSTSLLNFVQMPVFNVSQKATPLGAVATTGAALRNSINTQRSRRQALPYIKEFVDAMMFESEQHPNVRSGGDHYMGVWLPTLEKQNPINAWTWSQMLLQLQRHMDDAERRHGGLSEDQLFGGFKIQSLREIR